jgi:hypothetical protein
MDEFETNYQAPITMNSKDIDNSYINSNYRHYNAIANSPTASTYRATSFKQPNNHRTMMLDSGTNIQLHSTDVEQAMKRCRPSQYTIEVANQTTMKGSLDGELSYDIINTQGYQDIPHITKITRAVTTAQAIGKELFSIDELYRTGHSILLRHPSYECGVPEIYKPASDSDPIVRIPARFDWQRGGFWIDYNINEETGPLLRAYSAEQVNTIVSAAQNSNEVIEIVYGQSAEERNIRGVKSGLRQRKSRLTAKEFHEEHGHLGCQPDCMICKLTKGSMRRIYKVIDKHREQRPAHTWVMDGVTFSERALCGSKYAVILRCKATGVFKVLFLYLRSDIAVTIKEWITAFRADPAYRGLAYLPISFIETDQAGEWGRKCAVWNALEIELEFKTIYKASDRKEEASNAERGCGIIEVVTKSILMQQNLPPEWWARAAAQAEWLLNRFPISAQDVSVPLDGDQARPLEIITRGLYSRRQIDRELSYFISIGTPALVHEVKAKGSTLGPKSQWGIAIGMYREIVEFWSPHTNATRLSKSYTAFKLRPGMNFAQFLALPKMPTTQRSAAIPSDFYETVVIQLPSAEESRQTTLCPIEKIKTAGHSTDHPRFEEHNEDSLTNPRQNLVKLYVSRRDPDSEINLPSGAVAPQVTPHENPTETTQDSELGRELRGSVKLYDSDGCQLVSDADGYIGYDRTLAKPHRSKLSGVRKVKASDDYKMVNRLPDCQGCWVSIATSLEVTNLFDSIDKQSVAHKTITTGMSHTFTRVCKEHNLPLEKHQLYKQWLIQSKSGAHSTGRALRESDLPTVGRVKLQPNLRLPYPSGYMWRHISPPKDRYNQSDEAINKQLLRIAEAEILDTLQQQKQSYRATGHITLDSSAALHSHASAAKKRKRASTTGEPASTLEALNSEHNQEWATSCDEEINGLIKMGVLDHNGEAGGWTLNQLNSMGIKSKPVPIGLYHTHKVNKEGEIIRRKTRAALQGHPGNMQKGIHFNETFASTPSEDSQRFLTCLTVALDLKRKTGDVEKAYCWASLPPGELIAVRYPDVYKRFNQAGEELYMIMRRNLYGHPAAGRSWEMERNSKLLTHFNTNNWKCKRLFMDPCMFQFTSPEGKYAWAIIHTDDIDAAGQGDTILTQIFEIINRIWSIKETDSEYMLGISRKLVYKEGKVHSIECTMTPYVQGAVEAFKQYIIHSALSVPFPQNIRISRIDVPTEAEIREVLELGFQRAVGIIMWAARHCFPELKFGISKLCSVMSKPTHIAFQAAMHMISYMGQNMNRGIIFRADGNKIPVVTCDASNKPDPFDSKCQGAFVTTWYGGPLSVYSKKMKHIGHSAAHNEYMIMASAVKRVVWLRQLISEISVLQEILDHPTLVLGDNTQAIRLSREEFITSGNQYIDIAFHYITKEKTRDGTVEPRWIPGLLNTADLGTKAFSRQVFERLIGGLTGYGNPAHMDALLAAFK